MYIRNALRKKLEQFSSDQNMAAQAKAREKALVIMIREGEPFMVGPTKVWFNHATEKIHIDGRVWQGEGQDQALIGIARRHGWTIVPANEKAREVFARYRMFHSGSQTGT